MIETEHCPDCGSHKFFVNKEKGELICKNCSFVVEDALVDFGKDSRAFDDDSLQENSRTGAPFDPRVTDNLATQIGNSSDIAKLSGKTRALIQRIKKKNNWTSNSFEQNLNTAMGIMRIIAGNMSVPSSVEKDAAVMYRRVAEKNLAMRSSIENLVVATLYIACKMHGIPRPMREFSLSSKVDLKTLGKTYKLVLRHTGLKIQPVSPMDYVSKLSSALKFTPKVQTKTVKMIEKMEKMALTSGLSPLSVSSAALYMTSILEGEKRTQKQFAEVTNITETTLRNRCKSLSKKLGIKLK